MKNLVKFWNFECIKQGLRRVQPSVSVPAPIQCSTSQQWGHGIGMMESTSSDQDPIARVDQKTSPSVSGHHVRTHTFGSMKFTVSLLGKQQMESVQSEFQH